MGDTKKETTGTTAARPRCEVSDVRGGLTYRCSRAAGHELSADPDERAHEAIADEYCHRAPDWPAMFLEARPLLEWIAQHPEAGAERTELARRLLVRHYLAASQRPGLARTLAP